MTGVGKQISDQLQQILASVPGRMVFIGDLAADIIRRRTRHLNLSLLGTPFRPYTPGYAKRKGVSRNAVDLTDTHEMLDSIMVRNGDGVAFDPSGRGSQFRGQPSNRGQFVAARNIDIEVGPTGFRNIGLAEIHNRNRPFIGLTEQEQDELAEEFGKGLHQAQPTSEVTTLNITLG